MWIKGDADRDWADTSRQTFRWLAGRPSLVPSWAVLLFCVFGWSRYSPSLFLDIQQSWHGSGRVQLRCVPSVVSSHEQCAKRRSVVPYVSATCAVLLLLLMLTLTQTQSPPWRKHFHRLPRGCSATTRGPRRCWPPPSPPCAPTSSTPCCDSVRGSNRPTGEYRFNVPFFSLFVCHNIYKKKRKRKRNGERAAPISPTRQPLG